MSLSVAELEAEAQHLSPPERAELAQRLFASLEDGDEAPFDAAAVEQAWIEEAERRYQDYLEGKVKGIPAAEAIAEIRAHLRTL